MSSETERIYARLASLETEVTNLRQGYVIVNERYSVALDSLKGLATHATEAARLATHAAADAVRLAEEATAVARPQPPDTA